MKTKKGIEQQKWAKKGAAKKEKKGKKRIKFFFIYSLDVSPVSIQRTNIFKKKPMVTQTHNQTQRIRCIKYM